MAIVFKHEWIMFMDKFVRNLKIIRLIRGMSVRQVAQKIDRTPGTISNWETGKIAPDVDSVAKLCKIYDISPNELLGWDDCQLIEDFLAEKKDQLETYDSLIEQKLRLEEEIKRYMKIFAASDVDVDIRYRNPKTNKIEQLTIEAMEPKKEAKRKRTK